jgi:hypothetical protein
MKRRIGEPLDITELVKETLDLPPLCQPSAASLGARALSEASPDLMVIAAAEVGHPQSLCSELYRWMHELKLPEQFTPQVPHGHAFPTDRRCGVEVVTERMIDRLYEWQAVNKISPRVNPGTPCIQGGQEVVLYAVERGRLPQVKQELLAHLSR